MEEPHFCRFWQAAQFVSRAPGLSPCRPQARYCVDFEIPGSLMLHTRSVLRHTPGVLVVIGALMSPVMARAAPPDPGAACMRALARDAALQPLAAGTPLAIGLPRPVAMPLALLANTHLASPDDKPLVAAWSAKQQHCFELGAQFRAQNLTPESQTILADQQRELQALMGQLYLGELSYGEFNRERQRVYDKYAQQASGSAQKMFDQRNAQTQAAQQALLDSQRAQAGGSDEGDADAGTRRLSGAWGLGHDLAGMPGLPGQLPSLPGLPVVPAAPAQAARQ
jgi:hypothetical protein